MEVQVLSRALSPRTRATLSALASSGCPATVSACAFFCSLSPSPPDAVAPRVDRPSVPSRCPRTCRRATRAGVTRSARTTAPRATGSCPTRRAPTRDGQSSSRESIVRPARLPIPRPARPVRNRSALRARFLRADLDTWRRAGCPGSGVVGSPANLREERSHPWLRGCRRQASKYGARLVVVNRAKVLRCGDSGFRESVRRNGKLHERRGALRRTIRIVLVAGDHDGGCGLVYREVTPCRAAAANLGANGVPVWRRSGRGRVREGRLQRVARDFAATGEDERCSPLGVLNGAELRIRDEPGAQTNRPKSPMHAVAPDKDTRRQHCQRDWDRSETSGEKEHVRDA